MVIRKPKLLRSLVGRKLSKPKFLRFPSFKQLFFNALKTPKAIAYAKKGGIQQLARTKHVKAGMELTRADLPRAVQNMPEESIAELLQITDYAMQIPIHGLVDTVIDTGVGNFPAMYEFDTRGNYLSEQGGRVGIGVEVGIFNPETDQMKDIFHTFIFDDLPSDEELERMIDEFVQQVCDSPAFAYLKDGDGYCNFLYNMIAVDYVT